MTAIVALDKVVLSNVGHDLGPRDDVNAEVVARRARQLLPTFDV